VSLFLTLAVRNCPDFQKDRRKTPSQYVMTPFGIEAKGIEKIPYNKTAIKSIFHNAQPENHLPHHPLPESL